MSYLFGISFLVLAPWYPKDFLHNALKCLSGHFKIIKYKLYQNIRKMCIIYAFDERKFCLWEGEHFHVHQFFCHGLKVVVRPI